MSDPRSLGGANRGDVRVWEHPTRGKFAAGLFKMHDTYGFSLTDSLFECRKWNVTPCLLQFIGDALAAGWTRDKAHRVVREALHDAMAPVEWWAIAGLNPSGGPADE